ncbi:MAG: prepilin-type N-terminal cleavage/methylation domain-containing protein [Gemmatimonadota bacterium]
MSRLSCAKARSAGGFTLIEVIGALVIFSLGVLMVMQVSGALGTQMRYAGVRSELQVRVTETLDSLEAMPFSSLPTGSMVDTLTIGGIEYQVTAAISSVTTALKQIDVNVAPTGGQGPSYSVTSYATDPW